MPDELWSEVCDIVQETGIKTITMDRGAQWATVHGVAKSDTTEVT